MRAIQPKRLAAALALGFGLVAGAQAQTAATGTPGAHEGISSAVVTTTTATTALGAGPRATTTGTTAGGTTTAGTGTTASGTTTGGTTTTGTTATLPPAPTSRVSGGDTRRYAELAGGRDNAARLLSGLRNGGSVTLAGQGADAGSTTFDLPTRPLSHGETRIALNLAQRQLAKLGISNPTPEQLKAALVGGTVTTTGGSNPGSVELKGVLTQRSQGMGWGRVAHANGMRLGDAMRNPSGDDRRAGRVVTARGERAEHHRSGDDDGARHGGRDGMVSAAGSRAGERHDDDGAHRHRGGRSGAVSANGSRVEDNPARAGDDGGVHQHRGGRVVSAAGGAAGSVADDQGRRHGGRGIVSGAGVGVTRTEDGAGHRGVVSAGGAEDAGRHGRHGGRSIVSAGGGSAGGVRAEDGARHASRSGVVSALGGGGFVQTSQHGGHGGAEAARISTGGGGSAGAIRSGGGDDHGGHGRGRGRDH